MNNTKADSFLISQYLAGDEKSLETLVDKHKSRIFNFIYSKVLDRYTAEDIFQETFIKVIKTLKKGLYNEEGKFLPWIMRISHNLIIDYFRKNKRLPMFDNCESFDIFSILKDDIPNAENIMIDKQIKKDLVKIISELPMDQKNVIIMRLYKNMSFKEIADISGVSINTALGRMRYAIINIRKLIEQHQIVLSA
mgnify:FL=1|tara:strand:+ start:21 stop:602 length:582 start_codon:yes stop_codon:yes gene_type:complete